MAHGSLFTVDNRQGIVSRSTGEFLKIHANTTRYFDEIAHFCEQGQAINAKKVSNYIQTTPEASQINISPKKNLKQIPQSI
ncbi:hypothetical protein SS1G_13104 [Sclerotinia sclerotiorum 1980 UF-70]|uniref:Uncharacterized protein n=1 Tax=Sclerotinia sclerotiorum (strain ATCC 18683 / 1980 / Ss-1) TaxID=665079 RepID=A7F675_SCLS1|nr:hypothetical protein SS1G_13104 [Sclerotinia sclerotiorum 1980 UF-70]EDN98246.1 hypothetical protein SS1G_13104 [Sclerotinia sclerotiorum 1980 UF-70]